MGINEAIRADAQGMGFAIPIKIARERLKELSSGQIAQSKETGRPWLGISMGEIDQLSEEVRREYGLKEEGVFVAEVVPDSPADRAGLEQFDMIVSLDRQPIKTGEQLQKLVREAKIGQVVSLVVDRAGKYKVIKAKLGVRPEEPVY